MTDMTILEEAGALINGQRAKDYGPAAENFQRIADLWSTYMGFPDALTAHDVAQMMILVKVARQASGYHRDSAVDIAGYAALDEKVHEELPDYSFFIEHMSSPIVPRVWQSLDEIPEGVTVEDRGGTLWDGEDITDQVENGLRGLRSSGDLAANRWAPFTEYLEGNE